MSNVLEMADSLGEYELSIKVLLDAAVSRPNLQQFVISEIFGVIGKTKCDTKMPFYKHLNTVAVRSLEWRLAACGILTEEDTALSAISPFMDKILFQLVTSSAIECAEYCVHVWLERYAKRMSNN